MPMTTILHSMRRVVDDLGFEHSFYESLLTQKAAYVAMDLTFFHITRVQPPAVLLQTIDGTEGTR